MRRGIYAALLTCALGLAIPARAYFNQSQMFEAMYGYGDDPYLGFVDVKTLRSQAQCPPA